MVKISPFQVSAWFDHRAHDAKHGLAGTASDTISIQDLINLSEHPDKTEDELSFRNIKLDYASPMRGSQKLRENLAALYSARSQGVTQDDILTANAGIDANHIVLAALVGPTDHVICHYPTYEQLYQVPRSLGAEVTLWKCSPSNKWQLDIEELKTMIKDNTKMIIINNPHNPSGAIIPKPELETIMEIAEEKGLIVMSDEVFRPLFHSILPSDDAFPPSAINLGYKKVVVTGGIIEPCHAMRYYTTTTVSQLDETVAAEALSDRCIHALLARNIQNCQTNIEAWQNFIDEHNWACSWVRPVAGTTAMIKFHKMGKPVDDEKFCLDVQEKAGVGLIPGSVCFGDREHFQGYVRVGVGLDPAGVKEALAVLAKYMEEEYAQVPTAAR